MPRTRLVTGNNHLHTRLSMNERSSETKARIDDMVAKNPVLLFMKGNR
jgi:hypothetical protein